MTKVKIKLKSTSEPNGILGFVIVGKEILRFVIVGLITFISGFTILLFKCCFHGVLMTLPFLLSFLSIGLCYGWSAYGMVGWPSLSFVRKTTWFLRTISRVDKYPKIGSKLKWIRLFFLFSDYIHYVSH